MSLSPSPVPEHSTHSEYGGHCYHHLVLRGLAGPPRWLGGKECACQCRRHGFDPGSGASPGEGNGHPLQHSCLGNPMDRKAWCATVHEVTRVRHDGAHTECWSLVPVALQETTPGRWRELGSQLEGLDLHTSHPHLRLGNLGFPGGSDGKESACSAG